MHPAASLGEIITFYSYKGGTGRTMALANAGYLLAQENEHEQILMIDWDLEAPGLHRYFRGHVLTSLGEVASDNDLDKAPGLIDLLLEIKRSIYSNPDASSETSAQSTLTNLDWDRFFLQTDIPNLHLLKAGCLQASYAAAVNTFDWEGLHSRCPWFFRTLAERLTKRFRYVLIDSRTGVTDSSAICTSVMPDMLVLVFTPNRQSLLGALEAGAYGARYRKDSDDLRPFRLLPLPSRIEAAEPVLRDEWRFGDVEHDIPGYQPAFERLFNTIYDLPACDLDDYFSEIQIQHVPRFAYGEEIAARIESGDRLSITRSFQCFLKRLQAAGAPWETPVRLAQSDVLRSDFGQNGEWMAEKRAGAEAALSNLGPCAYMEASLSMSEPLKPVDLKRLFQAAKTAQISGVGWPIGAVVGVSKSQFRPRLASGEIVAEIMDKFRRSYDYWALRDDATFYFVRNLQEEPEYILVDERVDLITELLLYAKRLYSFLGTEPSMRIRISVRFTGLQDRELGCRKPDDPDTLIHLAGAASGTDMATEVIEQLANIQGRIVSLVKELARPLFLLFDLYELPDSEFERLVSRRLQDWGFDAKD